MNGLDLLKMALEEGVKILPKNFLKDNNIKAKCLGVSHKPIEGYDGYYEGYHVYLIEEEGEFKDKIVHVW